MSLRRALYLALTSLCASACLAQSSAPAAAAKLSTCSGLPCVELKIPSGRTLRLAIDSGDPPSTLDLAVATELKLDLQPLMDPNGKPYPGYSRTQIPDGQIGGAHLAQLRFVVLDRKGKQTNKDEALDVDGTIGYTVFKDRILQLDFARQTIALSDPLTSTSSCTAGKIEYLTFGQHGPPIVASTGFTMNDKPVVAQIDTMFSGAMLIYPTSVAKLGLDQESKSIAVQRFPYTDGGVNMTHSDTTSQGFSGRLLKSNASVYFATPGVHLPDALFDATVGMGLLSGHTATLDFHNNCFNLSS